MKGALYRWKLSSPTVSLRLYPVPDHHHSSGPKHLTLDLSGIIQVLSAVSSLAVIAGVVFVVFQLRQNRKLIEASNRQLEDLEQTGGGPRPQNRQQVLLNLAD